MKSWLPAALAVASLLLAVEGRADAGAPSAPSQAELFSEADRADRERDFARALTLYRAAERLQPGSRLAGRARARAAHLESVGKDALSPLAELEGMRQRGTPSLEELRAFDVRVASMPAGKLRREARLLVAETYLRLDRLTEARAAFERLLDEPGLDDAEFLLATNGVALSRARVGDLRGSLDTLRRAGLGATADAAHVELSMVRRYAAPLSWLTIASFVLGSLVLARRRLRGALLRALDSRFGALVVLLLGFPLGLAALHRSETWDAMRLLVPGSAVLAAFAWAVASGAEARYRRWLAALGVLAQLALAYLALDHAETLLGLWISWRIS